jgi:hypothetical protein
MKYLPARLSLCGALVSASPLMQAVSYLDERSIVKRGDDCSDLPGFVEPPESVGTGTSGGNFCLAKWRRGTFPYIIEAWADVNCLRWIRVRFTDGSEETVGSKPGDDGHHRTGTVTWNPWVDTFTKFSLWDDGWNGGVGRMVLELSTKCGETACGLDAGKYWDNPPPEHPISRGPEGQGMLLGFEGVQGDCIDSLKPIFSKSKPEKVVLRDAKFNPTFEELNEKPFA